MTCSVTVATVTARAGAVPTVLRLDPDVACFEQPGGAIITTVARARRQNNKSHFIWLFGNYTRTAASVSYDFSVSTQ